MSRKLFQYMHINSSLPKDRMILRRCQPLLLRLLFVVLCLGSGVASNARGAVMVKKEPFGNTTDGKAVEIYKLANSHGMEVRIMTYGGVIVSLKTPDKTGHVADIVLGFDTLAPYLSKNPYFGAIVGRYANRIGGARFTLDGKVYKLAANDGPNSLHGGLKGFDKVVWQAESFEKPGDGGVILRYTSPDGDEGYPGTVHVTVTYTLDEKDEFRIDYQATTDKATPINLTNHTYFNLDGEGSGKILGTEMMINADHFTPVDSTLIPTGKIAGVAGTPLDFTKPTPIGARIEDKYEQLALGHGYDFNFVINRTGPGLTLAARAYDPRSGRVLEVDTTEPGVQFYTGNFLNGVQGKHGHLYNQRDAFCLETQHYPDSPNKPGFPSTILRPGQTFHSTTVWKFSTR